jgi:hypothetical protein
MSMMMKKIRQTLAIILLIIGSVLLLWGIIPAKRNVVTQLIQPESMSIKPEGENTAFGILETHELKLEWPATMRIGDINVLELDFKDGPVGATPFKMASELSNAYGRYNLMAEARFEVAGVTVDPANPTRESMPEGQSVKFKWEINSARDGINSGKVWLSLRFLPLDSGTPIQIPIYVGDVKLQTTSLLGLSGPMARIAGGVGVILGLSLIFGDIIYRARKLKEKNATKNTTYAEDIK